MFRFLNQPKGILVIGGTEIFERLGYYTLASLLVLYASAPISQGGMGWSKEAALMLMGKFTFAVFTLPLIGGFIADRFMGPYRASVFGAIIIASGYALLYFSNHGVGIFYTALVLVVSGTAFFKPCMPTLLGLLYTPNDPRRAGGFNLYYMCINIGAMVAGFSAGLFLQNFGYQVALASAGGGMLLGLATFLFGKKYLVIPRTKYDMSFEAQQDERKNKISATHKKAFGYLVFSFVFFAVWAIAYNLVNSGTLSIYIENFTQKTIFNYNIPTTFFSSLNPIAIVVFAPIMTAVLGYCAVKKRPIHFFTQMNIALVLVFIGITYFTYLTKVAMSADMGTKPFSYLSIAAFILIISLSELLISPTIMAAISALSPPRLATSFQALNLSMIGFMGLVAGKIGAVSLSKPYETFYALSVVTFLSVILFLALRKCMIRAAINATFEMETDEAAKNTKNDYRAIDPLQQPS